MSEEHDVTLGEVKRVLDRIERNQQDQNASLRAEIMTFRSEMARYVQGAVYQAEKEALERTTALRFKALEMEIKDLKEENEKREQESATNRRAVFIQLATFLGGALWYLLEGVGR